MERRDRLVAAAMLLKEHRFAKEAIIDYEIEPPRRSYDQYAVRNQKYRHQQELAEYWELQIKALCHPMKFLDGLADYNWKFPYMTNDVEKKFLRGLQAALEEEPRAKGYPCVFKSDPQERQRLLQITQNEPSLPETMSSEIPSFEDARQARLEYNDKRAPFQHMLQRRTSELTLSSAPPVETMTQLKIASLKIEQAAEADWQKKQTASGDVLTFAEDILKAQLFQGKIYDGLTEEEKEIFQETVNQVPPLDRIEWLVDKLESHENLTYEIFVNNLCFIHVQNSYADGKKTRQFVLNYVHQKHLVPRKYKNSYF